MSNLKMSNGKDDLLQGQAPDAFLKVDPSTPKRNCHDTQQDQIQLLEDQIPPADLVQHQANHFRRSLFFIAGTLALLLACGLFGLKLFGSGAGERSVRTKGATRLFDDATIEGGKNNFDDHSVTQIIHAAGPAPLPTHYVELQCCGLVPFLQDLVRVGGDSWKSKTVGPSDIRKLSQALMFANAVTKLVLAINDEGAEEVAKLILDNERIETLRLKGIGDRGAEALANALAANPGLLALNLSDNHDISDKGAKALAKGLQTNTVLRRLDLDWDGIYAWDDGLGAFHSTEPTFYWDDDNMAAPGG